MLKTTAFQAAGVATHALCTDTRETTPALFLHGGSSGLTPFCSGAHVWGRVLDSFAAHRQVIAPDLPGSGQTPALAGTLTIDSLGEHTLALLQAAKLGPCHLVGHDEGGLVGLWLALNAPEMLRSLTVVASRTAAPTGDSLPVLTLNNPPQPLWSRVSQAWVLEQISYSYAHVTDDLLDACMAASEGAPHQTMVQRRGSPCPVQLVWGSHDPLTPLDRGFGMFEVIARKQPVTRFDIVNRAGNLPFREEPHAFHDVVAAFQAGVNERHPRHATIQPLEK
jgi:2-hydroxy-6-oxonona-2,4-dienedioate hydrolase